MGFFIWDFSLGIFLLGTVEIFNKVTVIKPLLSRIILRCTGNKTETIGKLRPDGREL